LAAPITTLAIVWAARAIMVAQVTAELVTTALAATTAVPVTTMADTHTIVTTRAGRTITTGIIRIRTMGVTHIATTIRTTRQRMATTHQRLQRCSTAWVKSATTTARSMESWDHEPVLRSPLTRAAMAWAWTG